MNRIRINSFDIDGVINMGAFDGIYPGPNDVIITGRSFEEAKETNEMLRKKGINNPVFFNPLRFDQKTRVSSGIHKGSTIAKLRNNGLLICLHYEDDPIQIEQIKLIVPEIHIIAVQHDLVEKENVRHVNNL